MPACGLYTEINYLIKKLSPHTKLLTRTDCHILFLLCGNVLCILCTGVQPEEQGVLVRQSFPFHGKGDVGQIPDPYLSKELSRLVTCQGAVVRSMRDGATQVHIIHVKG